MDFSRSVQFLCFRGNWGLGRGCLSLQADSECVAVSLLLTPTVNEHGLSFCPTVFDFSQQWVAVYRVWVFSGWVCSYVFFSFVCYCRCPCPWFHYGLPLLVCRVHLDLISQSSLLGWLWVLYMGVLFACVFLCMSSNVYGSLRVSCVWHHSCVKISFWSECLLFDKSRQSSLIPRRR